MLGQVVFSQGNCKPGMGVKSFPQWTSIYVAAPNLPAPVLRGIAGFAGVHLYNRDGDVLYATRDLLSIHTVAGGDRTFRLPRQVEEVYDLFERRYGGAGFPRISGDAAACLDGALLRWRRGTPL